MCNPIRPSLAAVLLASALIVRVTGVMAAERVLERSFAVQPGGLLTVNAQGADVTVSGSDANQVVVYMIAKASQKELDALKLSAAQNEGGVIVEMLRPDGHWFNWSSWNIDAQIKVTVPRRYRTELKTSGGDIKISRLDGDATGRTSGGSVGVEEVTGQVRMSTSGGDIIASDVKGAIDVKTSGGSVQLKSIDGPAQARSSGGNIIVTGIHGNVDASTSGGNVRLLRIDGKISARTSGGDVHCDLIGTNRGISATTSGGSIQLTMAKDITATLDAVTSGGRITTEFPVTVHGASGERSLSGPINGGGEAIYARTSGGSIVLTAGQ